MDALKKFFSKIEREAKFKSAGEGKKLTSSSSRAPKSRHSHHASHQRFAPSAEAQSAGAAALARFESTAPREVNWSLQAIKAQAKREMEMENKMAEMRLHEEKQTGHTLGSTPQERHFEGAPMLAVQGVYFFCPLLGPEVSTYEEIKKRIREFLYSQLEEDKGVAACLIIQSCNKNKEKIGICLETLCKYIENIISNPDEPKYRKIRQSNRAFQDRVAQLEGTKEFLEAAGFVEQDLPFNETTDRFWVFSGDKTTDLSALESLRDTLVSAEPIKPQLDRSLRVLLPKEAGQCMELPPEFFNLSIEDLKKEQQLRSESVQRSEMLMTKAMREKMEMREMRKYRFTLIRIRFPDGIILQGTFAINEKFGAVMEFLRENLVSSERPFHLMLSGGGKVTEEDNTLFELHLVPAVVFNFEWDTNVHDPNFDDRIYLKEEVLMLLQYSD